MRGAVSRATVGRPLRVRSKADVWRRDPLDDGGDWPEGVFLAYWLRRLAARRPEQVWNRLFTQYVRLKCGLYAHLVQDPLQPGLGAFVDTFKRLKPYREGLDRLRLDHILDEPELRGVLRAIEVRQDPKAPCELGRLAHELVRAERELAKGGTPVAIAAVLHILRDLKPASLADRSTHDADRESWAAKFARFESDARRVRIALEADPSRLRHIRGLDIAGHERHGPLWLAAPALREMRAHSRLIAVRNGEQPLRITLHVGEDFRTLTAGLRAIHEPIAWGVVEPGDRLGHALALTLPPSAWSDRHTLVRQPRWERLLDLAWLVAIVRGNWLRSPTGALPCWPPNSEARLLQQWSDSLREADVGEPIDPVDFYRSLGDEVTIRDWRDLGPRGNGLQRLFGLACQPSLSRHRAGAANPLFDIVAVDTAEDVPLLEVVRHLMCSDLARRNLAIEVNPTSNLVVGALRTVFDQPMLHLHPLQPRQPGDPDAALPVLPVAVHADDPLTFATCLADEYAYAWAGMTVAGDAAHAAARAWLDEAASVSWRWRFTVDVPEVPRGSPNPGRRSF
jgi:hypothetical protein